MYNSFPKKLNIKTSIYIHLDATFESEYSNQPTCCVNSNSINYKTLLMNWLELDSKNK